MSATPYKHIRRRYFFTRTHHSAFCLSLLFHAAILAACMLRQQQPEIRPEVKSSANYKQSLSVKILYASKAAAPQQAKRVRPVVRPATKNAPSAIEHNDIVKAQSSSPMRPQSPSLIARQAKLAQLPNPELRTNELNSTMLSEQGANGHGAGDKNENEEENKSEGLNLSTPAKLILGSIKPPEFSDEALAAELEGTFFVKVFVGKHGEVLEAKLTRPVGYGMDRLILASVQQARFLPRKDKQGLGEEAWTSVAYRLELP